MASDVIVPDLILREHLISRVSIHSVDFRRLVFDGVCQNLVFAFALLIVCYRFRTVYTPLTFLHPLLQALRLRWFLL